jgi:PadR family transcriptional regulator AphA
MAAGRVPLRYFLLGLLAGQPMSGYDIKQFLNQLGWLIGSPSCGSLYPALRALLRDGLATVDTAQTEGKPLRKVYTLTTAGKTALQHWLGLPAASFTLKDFAMRLLLANHLAPAQIINCLRQRRLDVADQQERLERIVEVMGGADGSGRHLALHYALALARAELGWLDGTLSALDSASPPFTVDALA